MACVQLGQYRCTLGISSSPLSLSTSNMAGNSYTQCCTSASAATKSTLPPASACPLPGLNTVQSAVPSWRRRHVSTRLRSWERGARAVPRMTSSANKSMACCGKPSPAPSAAALGCKAAHHRSEMSPQARFSRCSVAATNSKLSWSIAGTPCDIVTCCQSSSSRANLIPRKLSLHAHQGGSQFTQADVEFLVAVKALAAAHILQYQRNTV